MVSSESGRKIQDQNTPALVGDTYIIMDDRVRRHWLQSLHVCLQQGAFLLFQRFLRGHQRVEIHNRGGQALLIVVIGFGDDEFFFFFGTGFTDYAVFIGQDLRD